MKITYRNVEKIFVILMISALAVLYSIILFPENQVWYLLAVMISASLFVLGFVVKLRYWVCPHCRSSLPWRSICPNYCPHCGEKIDWS